MKLREFLLDTSYARASIMLDEKRIVRRTAPIYRRYNGWKWENVFERLCNKHCFVALLPLPGFIVIDADGSEYEVADEEADDEGDEREEQVG